MKLGDPEGASSTSPGSSQQEQQVEAKDTSLGESSSSTGNSSGDGQKDPPAKVEEEAVPEDSDECIIVLDPSDSNPKKE